MTNAEKRRNEVPKEVFFIHHNTRPVKLGNSCYTQITTNYVCAKGFKTGDNDRIYNSMDFDFELDNCFPGTWWDTYEEGEKELAKLIKNVVAEFNTNIKDNYNKLKDKYPEVMI